MLDNFRKIDLVWNNAYEKLGNVRTAQFDEKGRKLVVQVTDDGDIVDLTGVELKLVTIDEIEVGGRNLVVNSNFQEEGNFNGWRPVYGRHELTGNGYLKEYTSTTGSTRIEKSITLEEAGTFTYSIYAKTSQDIEWRGLVGLSAPTQRVEYSDDFKVYSFTFTNNEPGDKIIRGYQPNIPVGSTVEILWEKLEKGNIATDWTPAPEDLQFPFDLIDAQKGIYELYFPKFFVDRYAGDTKVFLELTTKDFSVTSEPFYINVFEGVR